MAADIYRFGDFELDQSAYQLRRKDRPLKLERIPLDLLFLLIDRRGQLVTRAEIFEQIWGKDLFLDTDNAINSAVRKIRRALHDDPDAPRFVVTVPAKGYRFVAEVSEASQRPRYDPGKISRSTQRSIVGRDSELAELCAGLNDAMAKRGRLFLISGDPGIGKTRLADEVGAVAAMRRMRLLVGHCSDRDEAVPYLPFVEILENFIDHLPNRDDLRGALGDQGQELARLLPKLKNLIPELAPPLELPPAQAQRHLFNCFCDFIARMCREQPALMILDDLHWADDSTLSLLDRLTQQLSGLPLLLIGTYRDADLNVTRGLAKTLEDLNRGHRATPVRLKGLPRDEVAVMLTSLSGRSPPASVVSEIYAETAGNPFFVEELFRHLEEENRLYDPSGDFRSELNIGELDAPPSVRLVVAARLSDLTQNALATAAVIGRFFNFELLQASCTARADSLLECLEEAEKAGLIFSVMESPGARFEFSHELVRQAVIGGVSPARRPRLHLEIAAAIEQVYSDGSESIYAGSVDDHVADLAHHYTRGGDSRKAVDYLARAAEQAAQRSAHAQAAAFINSALELLNDWPQGAERAKQELALRLMLARSRGATAGYVVMEHELERARELCLQIGEPAQLFRALWGLWNVYHVQAKFQPARELAEQLLTLAQGVQNPLFLLGAHEALGTTLLWLGEFTLARVHLDHGVALYDPEKRRSRGFRAVQDPGVDCLSFGALALWFLGYPEQALTRIYRAVELARELAHPYTLAYALIHTSLVHHLRGEAPSTQQLAEAAIAICAEHGFTFFSSTGAIYRGWALAAQGREVEGIAEIREGLAVYRTTGSGINWPHNLLFLAEAYRKAEQTDEGLRTLSEALGIVDKTGERFFEVGLHQLRGTLTLQSKLQGPRSDAEAKGYFHKAIEAARRQNAKSWELRAATSLARLLAKQNHHDEARTMLSQIYDWFTEGFDTADLRDAKALLDQLNR